MFVVSYSIFFYVIVKFSVVFVEEVMLRAIPVKYGHISTEITKYIPPPHYYVWLNKTAASLLFILLVIHLSLHKSLDIWME